ncbi:MAG: ATP-dependent DNA helicase RecG [Deltaproteobacteria bacterium]|nr:ATP-dependent DNA helicase RecG [Deltaproteobacteria bacterium]
MIHGNILKRANTKAEAFPLLKQVQRLSDPLTRLEQVGPKRASLMAKKGISSILDLLFFTPSRYEDRTRIYPLGKALGQGPRLVRAKVLYGKEEVLGAGRKRTFKLLVEEAGALVECIWFNYRKPYLQKFSQRGTEVLIYGSLLGGHGRIRVYHPEIELYQAGISEGKLGFYPVYPSIEGISPKVLRSIIRRALDLYLPQLVDPVPEVIRKRLCLPGLAEALRDVHFPPKDCAIGPLNAKKTVFHKRLVFDRFFLAMLILSYSKRFRKERRGQAYFVPPGLERDAKRFFGFELTAEQKKAIREIAKDLGGLSPMNRLVIGDVGCGKTVLAAVAAYICTQNGEQVALMVPTQVLANQHFDFFSALSGKMGLRPVLLTGKLKAKERKDIYEKIRKGCYNLIIGTHVLAGYKVTYSRLGLVIIDEQHRFGVRQRALMHMKGDSHHQLVISATPIPRTLALAIYGDMDISVIREHPKAYRAPSTYLAGPEKKRRVFEILLERLSAGGQAFVICPVIKGSEEEDIKSAKQMADRLRGLLSPRFRVGLVHGRMGPEEVADVMGDFRNGLIDLLVGTSLVEVGVHVPKAQVMIIEHPERFGLAQLHQLRGRVGRGEERGICFLMLSERVQGSSLERLKIFAESQDGFEISQKDLEMRGQGEFFGTKQSGLGELDLQEMLEESDLLARAREEVEQLLSSDPELRGPRCRPLRILLKTLLARSGDL